jgi:hypothetical protein
MWQKIEDLVMQERHLKVFRILGDCNVSEPSILTILHDHRGISFISCWVLKMLNSLQKLCRVQFSEENLGLYEVLPRIITGDTTMN